MNETSSKRTVGLIGATGVGVGAILGGGIFVLAGVAFAATGPGAVVAFALNGCIAGITALSFSEMSSAFPESGGSYAFARRVLSVRAAFAAGWILWLAYMLATVLYALGFASYLGEALRSLVLLMGDDPSTWVSGSTFASLVALGLLGMYTTALARRSKGGGQVATIGKLVVFGVLVGAGLWALGRAPEGTMESRLSPLLPGGASGLIAAMGFTFVACQGFDLISAIAGEVNNPRRVIPRAMLLSLVAAMFIYLPLLVIVATVGVSPDEDIRALGRTHPETIVAIAAARFMGPAGYWLVVLAALLATLSALAANFMAASRVAHRMACDRTLPSSLDRLHPTHGTPVSAVYATAVSAALLILLLPDLSTAGAAASLIFLASFALTHVTAYLARRRGGARPAGFVTPFFPLVPIVGGIVCGALAIFQAVVVPYAGAVVIGWMAVGAVLYGYLFSRRAEAVDAYAEAQDPTLVKLRGRRPLVLVPVINPANASALVAVGNAVASPTVGRVLLLSVVPAAGDSADGPPAALLSAQASLTEALTTSLADGRGPEALLTIAPAPLPEIVRVAELHGCESLLLGFGRELPDAIDQAGQEKGLEQALDAVLCDVLVLRSPSGWHPDQVKRILVPLGGRGRHDALRARLLASLCRRAKREVTFFRAFPLGTPDQVIREAEAALARFGREEVGEPVRVVVERVDDVPNAISKRAEEADLVILGMRRVGRRQKVLGGLVKRLAREADVATLMIGRAE